MGQEGVEQDVEECGREQAETREGGIGGQTVGRCGRGDYGDPRFREVFIPTLDGGLYGGDHFGTNGGGGFEQLPAPSHLAYVES